MLNEWLEQRGDAPGPLFITRSGTRLDRTQAFVILRRLARQANVHLPPDEHLQVAPHVLRRTLLRRGANEKGVHDAIGLSGHRSDRYIWRCVKPDAQSLVEALDGLDEPTDANTRVEARLTQSGPTGFGTETHTSGVSSSD